MKLTIDTLTIFGVLFLLCALGGAFVPELEDVAGRFLHAGIMTMALAVGGRAIDGIIEMELRRLDGRDR